ncbi:MAG: GNAT family N-acetyltransferase [Chitinophagaceae bacterium]|jgi:GNAT superfamily N-acetyltransferase|nr:GNAT family N-acetyltransferase [Chitinophagaceae bacterium]
MNHPTHKATLNELDELSILFDEYRQFYKKETDVVAAKVFLKERMERNESEIFYTKNDAGEMTGFIQLYPLFSSVRMKRKWLLNDLYVRESFRGKGYSLALIERAKQFAKETGTYALSLSTEKTNAIGNRLYIKTGFVQSVDWNYYDYTVC